MSMSRSLITSWSASPLEGGALDTSRSPRRSWRTRFVFGLGLALVAQGLAGGVAKLAAGRTDDFPHTVLHVVSGLAGLVALRRHSDAAARTFAAVFGILYLALAALGWGGSPAVAVGVAVLLAGWAALHGALWARRVRRVRACR